MTALAIPPAAVLRASLADACRESRSDAVMRLAGRIDAAISAAENALFDCDGERDRRDVADILVALGDARDAAERMNGRR